MRGPVALPHPYSGKAVPLRRPSNRGEFFLAALTDAVTKVGRSCPGVLSGIDIGAEDVPPAVVLWREDRVPLAAAIEATSESPARIVLFQRPLEHRAISRSGLRFLVHRTLVEQLSALTGRSVDDIDPELDDDDL